jgi:hypothetical protein
MATFQVQESWNSRSQHTVCAYDDSGNRIGVIGIVYAPRGRRWATVEETGHAAFKGIVCMADGLNAGAQALFDRFQQGMHPTYSA